VITDNNYNHVVLTLKPLYHSLMVASSYLVWDFKKSMSSLDNLSLLPKQPMSATKYDNITVKNLSAVQQVVFLRAQQYTWCFRLKLIGVKNISFTSIVFLSNGLHAYTVCPLYPLIESFLLYAHGNKTTWP